jgi:hypothetical protein
MKHQSFILLFSMLLLACSPKVIPYERTGMVTSMGGDKNTITLQSQGYAETESKAIHFAERNALENLLYKGIPRSNNENPMILQTSDQSHPALTKFVTDEYIKYLISSKVLESNKASGGYSVIQQTQWDVNSIRKYLEEKGVIKKFGL